MTWTEFHPALNATLNGAEFIFLVAGWRAIRRRDIPTHRAHMICALVASATFLVSYVTRFAMTGSHRYPGDGWDRTVYLAVLVSHSLIAVAVLPFILRTVFLALTSRFPEHRRIARWVWPVWIYVSVTGVVVYLMLYQLAPRLHGG
jgi:putative membrane protein